ncbi:hypothetical protein ABT186_40590 [Streptomyces sp. NPDC001634]|uniref:MmyB family transcriptional regulator n=1 Tax=Streptomyces sp. NPDC001634 TaxID=3154390 RepID=UPI00332F0911
MRSPEFSTCWNDHRVLRRTHGSKHYHHPLVGDLQFSYESLPVPGDAEQTLCVYNVEPGFGTAQALTLLSSWTASGTEGRSPSSNAAERLRAATTLGAGRAVRRPRFRVTGS